MKISNKKFIFAIFLSIFFSKFSFSSTCWYTFEEDTSRFEKIFIGKADTTIFLYVGFEAAYTKFIPLIEFKGIFYDNEPVFIRNIANDNYPFIKDSIYIIFSNKECETCYFSPYVASIDCSSSGLLSRNIEMLQKFKTKEIVDTTSPNSLYQKIKTERLFIETEKHNMESFYKNLKSKYNLSLIIILIISLLLLLFIILYLKKKC